MALDGRTITDAEVTPWCAALNTGFHDAKGSIDAELRRPSIALDRTWAAFDGAKIVSTLRTFSVDMTVPGGGSVVASGSHSGDDERDAPQAGTDAVRTADRLFRSSPALWCSSWF